MLARCATSRIGINCRRTLLVAQRFLASQDAVAANYEAALDYAAIPGPSRFSFVRDFMPGGEFRHASFYDYALAMHQRFGDIVVMPGVFGKPDMVMVINTRDIETVYRNEGQWPSRQVFDTLKHFREKVKGDFFQQTTGLAVAEGEEWGKIRSSVNPVLMKSQNLVMYIKPVQEVTDEFISRIKEIRDPRTGEVPDNFEYHLNRFIFETISLIALNRKLGLITRNRYDADAERLIECNRLAFTYIYKLDIQPSIWKFIRTPNYYRNLKLNEDMFRITQKFINETRRQIVEKSKRDENDQKMYSILEKLLLIDEKLAVVTAMDILFAGVDTTSVTILAILLCLAKNPEKQAKLREETLKVLPTKEAVLSEENMKSLPYLKAVIKESLRYYPNGTGSIRRPVQDVVLSGYKVPKGTPVVLNFNCLMKNEAYFSHADQFIPERWLRDDNNRKEKLDPFSYLPFGRGSRSCAGKRLAELEIEVVLLKLLRNFEIEFNYDATKPFKASFLNSPAIPMRFTFKDINY